MERNTALDFFFTVMRLFFGAVYDCEENLKGMDSSSRPDTRPPRETNSILSS
ncbi:hypothetical protein HMPREF1547_02363 [Blautia sp. KLE 1732]|nr:hypothetical protein HMPREF1547_02363 [Blautia sp. KLE 1732]